MLPSGSSPRDRLQIIAEKLIETLAEGHCFFAGAGDELVVDGQGNVHEHSICGHWLCVDAGRGPPLSPIRFQQNVTELYYPPAALSLASPIGDVMRHMGTTGNAKKEWMSRRSANATARAPDHLGVLPGAGSNIMSGAQQ